MTARMHFRGPLGYRIRSASELSQCILEASARRALKGPRLPGWNWCLELATEVLKRQTLVAFQMGDVEEARRYLDSVVISSPALSEVTITPVVQAKFRGSWFACKNTEPSVSLLYFHGGGYSFYPHSYTNFIALITQAAKSRTFALDYRLTPEHRFPAQLEDALNAYRWLLGDGADPDRLIFAGDSAGANLTLALLLAARESKLPLPALAIALSPPTDFETDLSGKGEFDWIEKPMLEQWAAWFCDSAERRNPLVSPIWADLRGLPPIYIQAGRAEILYASIQAFADRSQKQGEDVVLETWEDMTHDFQMFGPDSPQSAEALRRIGQVIDVKVRRQKQMETVSL
ncbi:MAG: alpha/beta hydrolase fold domain-containing protein [Terriglobales bacterium]|jgi:epsilon-lactone hydrolase